MQVDLLEFSRNREEAAGELAMAAMMRVESPERGGALRWRARGVTTPSGAVAFFLEVDGIITLVCQRCLEPMTLPVAIRSRFRIVADESAAAALDATDDDYDALVGSPAFDLDVLIEDEVILALPIAQRHAVCPPSANSSLAAEREHSPFAKLAFLKSSTGSNGER